MGETIILILSASPFLRRTGRQVKRQVHLILGQSAFPAVTSLALGYKLLGKTGIEGIGAAYLLSRSLPVLIVFKPLWRELRGGKAPNSLSAGTAAK